MIWSRALFIVSFCFAAAFGDIFQRQRSEIIKDNRIDFSFDGSEYIIGPFLEDWEGAKYYCKYRGMNLVSIESEEEQMAIINATMNLNTELWTSLNDQYSRDNYMWETTGAYAELYVNWDRDFPNVGTGNRCVILTPPSQGRTWYNRDCSETYRYICEKPIITCSTP